MPMPTAATRNSAMRTMSRAMPFSLLRLLRFRRLRLPIMEEVLLSCSPRLVIHQASGPHQCHHRPDAGPHINARGCRRQKIDREADRLDTICGGGTAVQYCRARRIVDALGQGDDVAKLVIGLKDRKIFEAADGSVVGGIACSPSRIARYVQPASVGQRVPRRIDPRHSAIDDILPFLTPRRVGLGKGIVYTIFRLLAALDGTGTGSGGRGIARRVH